MVAGVAKAKAKATRADECGEGDEGGVVARWGILIGQGLIAATSQKALRLGPWKFAPNTKLGQAELRKVDVKKTPTRLGGVAASCDKRHQLEQEGPLQSTWNWPRPRQGWGQGC